MRRWVVLVMVAAAAVAGCDREPRTVPGAAAPATASATTSAPATTPTATPPAGSSAGSSAGSAPPPAATTAVPPPTEFGTLTMDGFGASIVVPVPTGWTQVDNGNADRRNTDVTPPENPGEHFLVRVDLTRRAGGTVLAAAQQLAVKAAQRPGYRLGSFTPVSGVGDEALDWRFSYDADGTRLTILDRQIVAGTAGIAVYVRLPADQAGAYQPMVTRILAGLRITAT